MNNKLIIGVIIGFSILGVVLGFLLTGQNIFPRREETTSPLTGAITEVTPIKSSLTLAPLPTIPPLSRVVKSIDSQFFTVGDDEGSMRLTKTKVKVFTRRGEQLIPATVDDVKVGQKVTVKPIIPGQESHLIIEP